MLTSMFVLPLFQLRNPTNSLLYSLQNKLICKFWMCMLNQIRKLHLKIGGLFFFYRKERVRKNVSEITFLSLSYLFRLVCNVFDNYYLNCWKLSLYFYQFTCKVICINKPLMLSQKSVRKKKKRHSEIWSSALLPLSFWKFLCMVSFSGLFLSAMAGLFLSAILVLEKLHGITALKNHRCHYLPAGSLPVAF